MTHMVEQRSRACMCLGLTPGEAVWAAVDSNHLPPRSLALSAVLTRSEAECKSGCYLALTTDFKQEAARRSPDCLRRRVANGELENGELSCLQRVLQKDSSSI